MISFDAKALSDMKPVLSSLVFAVTFASATASAQGRLTTSPLESRPGPGEVETAQAGGHGVGRYSFVGALRCRRSDEAIVGARVSRVEVLDRLQIGCASIQCSQEGCRWSEPSWGMSAGNASASGTQSTMLCDRDQVLAGLRARVKEVRAGGTFDYVSDVDFECAQIVGPSQPGSGKTLAAFPVSDRGRTWRRSEEGSTSTERASSRALPATCKGFGATAVSVAVGQYVPTHTNVVQAISLFCAKPQEVTGFGRTIR